MKQHGVAQVFGPAQRRSARDRLRTAYRQHQFAEQFDRAARRSLRRAIAYCDLYAFSLQVEHLVVGGDANIDVGTLAAEIRQPWNQPQGGEADGGGNGKRAPGAAVLDLACGIGEQPQRLCRRAVQLVSRFGECQRAVAAHEQRDAEMVFDRLYLAAHGRLRHEQFLGRLGETEVACRRLESAQQVE